jgi:hypothetical protein
MDNTFVQWASRTILALNLGNASDVTSTEGKSWPSKDEQESQPQEAGVKLEGDHINGPQIRITLI